MGRAINMEKDLGLLRADIDQLKAAFEGLAATVETLHSTAPSKRTIDLHEYEETDTKNVKAEGKKSSKKNKTKKVVAEAHA